MEKDHKIVEKEAEPANWEYLGNEHGRRFTFDDMSVECFYGELPIEKIFAEVCK